MNPEVWIVVVSVVSGFGLGVAAYAANRIKKAAKRLENLRHDNGHVTSTSWNVSDSLNAKIKCFREAVAYIPAKHEDQHRMAS